MAAAVHIGFKISRRMVSFNEKKQRPFKCCKTPFWLLIAVLLCSTVWSKINQLKNQKVATVLRNQSKLGGGNTKMGTLQRTSFNSYSEQETLMFMSLLWGNSWTLFSFNNLTELQTEWRFCVILKTKFFFPKWWCTPHEFLSWNFFTRCKLCLTAYHLVT